MLKKIGIHFQKENIDKLNKIFPNIKISYLMDYLLNNFIKEYENKTWEVRYELRKDLQRYVQQSKTKKSKRIQKKKIILV